MAKKYYWLKLQKDFFKRHDIRIIEDMPNGKDYILFYMKLLVESIGHEGQLRFSETIPYNDSMLATITNTNIDIVRSAVKIFNELDLMSVMDDGTLFLSETSNMLGSVTDWAEKKKVYREKQKQIGQKEDMSDKSKSKSLEIDKELESATDNRNFSSEWETLKKYWNNKGLPEYRTMIMHESNSGELLNLMLPYSHEEILKAIDNYSQFLDQEEHPYQTFKGFMTRGIARFFDGAKPWTRYDQKEQPKLRINDLPEEKKSYYIKLSLVKDKYPLTEKELDNWIKEAQDEKPKGEEK